MKLTTTIAASVGAIALGLSGAAFAQTTTAPAPGTMSGPTPMQTTPIPPSSDPSMTPSQTPGTAPTNPTPDTQATPDANASVTASADTSATAPTGKVKKSRKHAATPQ